MLVICEDCAKKYNIDESKIKGNRARFTCNECGHIIIVEKSDLKRPLVKSANQNQSPSASFDLLKEMDAPIAENTETLDDTYEQKVVETSQSVEVEDSKTKGLPLSSVRKNLPIPAYFLLSGLMAFFVTNAGVAYLLFQYSSILSNLQKEYQFDMLITVVLVMLVAWAISFLILFGFGAYFAKKVNTLIETIHRVNMGEKNVHIPSDGPRELVSLAQIISELSGKVR